MPSRWWFSTSHDCSRQGILDSSAALEASFLAQLAASSGLRVAGDHEKLREVQVVILSPSSWDMLGSMEEHRSIEFI